LAKVSRDNNRIYDLSFVLCRLYSLSRAAACAPYAVECIPNEFDLLATNVRESVAHSGGRGEGKNRKRREIHATPVPVQ